MSAPPGWKFTGSNGFNDARFLVMVAFFVGMWTAVIYISADQLAGGPWKMKP